MVAAVLLSKNKWKQHIQIHQVDEIHAGCVGRHPAALLPARGPAKASYEPVKARTHPVPPSDELVGLTCPPRIGQHSEHRHPREVKIHKGDYKQQISQIINVVKFWYRLQEVSDENHSPTSTSVCLPNIFWIKKTEGDNISENNTKKDTIQQQAIDLFHQGLNITEIAEKLKVSKIHIVRCLPEELIESQIKELLKQGLGYYQIGDILGITGKTVKQRAIKAGINDTNKAQILRMFQNEIPINEITKKLNMNPQKVIAHIPSSSRCERLQELYIEQKLPYDEIISKFGIDRTSLKNWLRKYNLMNRHPNAGIEFKNYPKSRIIGDYLCLNSIDSIVKTRKYPGTTIIRILEEAGVKRTAALASIRKHVDGNHCIPINKYLAEVIVGELLSDGNLGLRRSNSQRVIPTTMYWQAIKTLQSFRKHIPTDLAPTIIKFNEAIEIFHHFRMARLNFVMSLLALPWALHINNIFENNSIPMSYKINDATITKARYNTVSVWSRNTVQFKDIFEQWYINGTKLVPKNIQMTPTTLLHWFIGDGHRRESKILFCTHNFTSTDVEFLSNLLNKTLGISSHWRYEKSKSNNQPVLAISRQSNVCTFEKYLDQASPDSLTLAKNIFPWKFRAKLRKRDAMRSEWYPEILRRYLGNDSDNVYSMIKTTIKRYYFKDS